MLSEKGFNGDQCNDIIRCVSSKSSGKVFRTNTGKRYCIDRGILLPVDEGEADCQIVTEIVCQSDFKPAENKFVEYFDISVLDGKPLTVRKWCKGDRIKPFGMKNGSRLVSDVMRDAGYSIVDKNNTRLLVKGTDILWIIGLRRSLYYPISNKSDKIVRITATSDLSTICDS